MGIIRRPGIIQIPAGVSDAYNAAFGVNAKDENGELGINLVKSPTYGFKQTETVVSDTTIKHYGIYYDPNLSSRGFSKGQIFNPGVKINYGLLTQHDNGRVYLQNSIIKPTGASDVFNSFMEEFAATKIPSNEITNQANSTSELKNELSYNWHYDLNKNSELEATQTKTRIGSSRSVPLID